MAFNKLMHPRNPYKNKPPDFTELAKQYESFGRHCCFGLNGKVHLDFRNCDAVRALTWAILKKDFDLDVELPSDCLVPRIPQRLNYILWLEDLIKQNELEEPITGIDVGTGASCIYPLLGARRCGWHFVAIEKDSEAFKVAERNVCQNDLISLCSVIKSDENDDKIGVFQKAIDRLSGRPFAFSMCNPPFFEREEREAKFTENDRAVLVNRRSGQMGVRHKQRQLPHSITVAKNSELCTDGGEVAFVGRLIEHSVCCKRAVRIYTSMIGKKSSLTPLKAKLRQIKDVLFAVTTFSQGKTQRWALAWSFYPDLRLDTMATRMKKAIRLDLTDKLLANGQELTPLFKNLMNSLQIVCTECADTNAHSRRFVCETDTNTWSHQRRKRRATSGPLFDNWHRTKVANGMSKSVRVGVRLGTGDGTDSLSDDGNWTTVDYADHPGGRRSVCVQTYLPNVDEYPLGPTTNATTVDEHPLGPTCKEIVSSIQSCFDKTADGQVPLVKFIATLNFRSNLVEFYWCIGRCPDAMQQIVQYCRNAVARF